jgi:alkanesulfonate monooxygenase SsuD/methylene tetrahydromethanopterin reductase-like flavin-dependent oxidoreductase (luciferase family)
MQMTSWGVLLPTFDPLRRGETFPVAEAARIAEQAGYASVWAGDHLKCPAPVLDATTCLAVAATVTTTTQIGFSVMLLGMRPLAWAAKQIATLQHLSGNRLRLGVGVGGEFPQEYAAAEIPHNRRGERLDEALRLLPEYLRPGTEHSLEPPAPMPPVLVGGRSDRAMERAARFGDAWLPMWVSPETLAQRGERLAELAGHYDRPAPSLSLLVLAHVDDDPARAREQAAAHLHGQYGMALERVERWTAFGSAEQVAEFLEPYTQIGVSEILLLPLGARPL